MTSLENARKDKIYKTIGYIYLNKTLLKEGDVAGDHYVFSKPAKTFEEMSAPAEGGKRRKMYERLRLVMRK